MARKSESMPLKRPSLPKMPTVASALRSAAKLAEVEDVAFGREFVERHERQDRWGPCAPGGRQSSASAFGSNPPVMITSAARNKWS